jgi:DNA polymerase
LQAEILAVAPKLIICLGATAAQSLMGADFRITKSRGQILDSEWAPFLMATYHPSAILRAPDSETLDRMQYEFIDDLRGAAKKLSA